MNQQRLMQVLLSPQISEKATFVAEKNEQVIFRVASDATKPEVKAAVELLFKVIVDSVLVITDSLDENVFLASRNLPNVLVLEVNEADPVSLIRFPKVLMTKNAVAKFEEILG